MDLYLQAFFTGSPHVHMLIWLKDSPNYEDKSCRNEAEVVSIKETICKFADTMITCSKKWNGTPHDYELSKCTDSTWSNLIKTRQTHKHTST